MSGADLRSIVVQRTPERRYDNENSRTRQQRRANLRKAALSPIDLLPAFSTVTV
jgi:hypothetical protein